ncbi:MAG: hypothetical protein ABI865_13090, partial [Nitrosospira sp.]
AMPHNKPASRMGRTILFKIKMCLMIFPSHYQAKLLCKLFYSGSQASSVRSRTEEVRMAAFLHPTHHGSGGQAGDLDRGDKSMHMRGGCCTSVQ